jgi:Flp pilus assembly protein TadG
MTDYGIRRRSDRSADESGVATVVVVAFVSAVLFGLAALAVDIARLQLEGQRLQKAADAAAVAGVTWMPQDLPNATLTARSLASRNGYVNGADSTTVAVDPGGQPSQLKVTITHKVTNVFGSMFGISSGTITRHAVADYTGPQPMGSPCNTMGNEPDDDSSGTGSKLVGTSTGCTRTPQFWANMFGPEINKGDGDEYATRKCAGPNPTANPPFAGEVDCTPDGKNNKSFDPQGYFFMVRVGPDAVDKPVTLQVYDPAFVYTGDRCDNAPTTSNAVNNDYPTTSNDNDPNAWNPYTTRKGLARYARSAGVYCSGDNSNANPIVPTITSFGLRKPTADANPLNGVPEPTRGCTRQFPGYAAPSVSNLLQYKLILARDGSTTQANPNTSDALKYKPVIASVFHQWVTLCTFTPAAAGDYYLQVRTNIALEGTVATTGADTGSYVPGTNANAKIFTQIGDDPAVKGNGSNRFAIRVWGNTSTVSEAVTVASWGKMPIYANADTASPVFNLIRVLPGAAGKTLIFKFFDAGDAATSGTMTVLRPSEASGDQIKDCVGSGYKNVALPTCSITGINKSNGWDGQAETISVPIPSNYDCASTSANGCWFRVNVSFGSGTVADTTTWTASVVGDPVRLIE